ncbi:hypothetical protein MJO29_014802 [Puccinia striiformis f. sp. tritici]|nr:hypothetical protein MJO29_014802 [Puccinia striiformis f. sp. tritici]
MVGPFKLVALHHPDPDKARPVSKCFSCRHAGISMGLINLTDTTITLPCRVPHHHALSPSWLLFILVALSIERISNIFSKGSSFSPLTIAHQFISAFRYLIFPIEQTHPRLSRYLLVVVIVLINVANTAYWSVTVLTYNQYDIISITSLTPFPFSDRFLLITLNF